MAALSVFDTAGRTRTIYRLEQERVRIGRKSHNDIVLKYPSVSSEHALIIGVGEDRYIEDLKSTNGTRVNGASVKRAKLRDGDVIRIGRFELRYIADAEATSDDAAPSGVLDVDLHHGVALDTFTASLSAPTQFSATVVVSSSAKSTPAPAGPGVMPLAAIQILSGPGQGKELELGRLLTTLGKPGVQVAVITRRLDGYFLTHVEGESGPMVNGSAIGDKPRRLEDHDIIDLAATRLEFYFR